MRRQAPTRKRNSSLSMVYVHARRLIRLFPTARATLQSPPAPGVGFCMGSRFPPCKKVTVQLQVTGLHHREHRAAHGHDDAPQVARDQWDHHRARLSWRVGLAGAQWCQPAHWRPPIPSRGPFSIERGQLRRASVAVRIVLCDERTPHYHCTELERAGSGCAVSVTPVSPVLLAIDGCMHHASVKILRSKFCVERCIFFPVGSCVILRQDPDGCGRGERCRCRAAAVGEL